MYYTNFRDTFLIIVATNLQVVVFFIGKGVSPDLLLGCVTVVASLVVSTIGNFVCFHYFSSE